MFRNAIICVFFIATSQCIAPSKRKAKDTKYKDLNIPGRYGDTREDSAIPGRYGDSSKKSYVKKTLIPGRYGDSSFQDLLKRNNDGSSYLTATYDELYESDPKSVKMQSLPGRYAGDEINTSELNENKRSGITSGYGDTTKDIPGRYGDESKRNEKKSIPGRYGDRTNLHHIKRNSQKARKDIPGRYGDERSFDANMRYSELNGDKVKKGIPGRYGDERKYKDMKSSNERFNDYKDAKRATERYAVYKDTKFIPGRYGDEEIIEKEIPGRYGDERSHDGIPGRYGDEKVDSTETKKKEKFRYKYTKTRFANQGPYDEMTRRKIMES